MNPGRMNRRLTIQVLTASTDAAGGKVESWADSFDCWAELVTHRGSEGQQADAERAVDRKQFRIRYFSGIAPESHRVLYQLKFYNITGIAEEGIKNRLVLDCHATQSLT